jgi:hypothetical protein
VSSWGTALTLTARASDGHGIEYWLAIGAAVGLVLSGWLCLTLRAVNALCAVAANQAWRDAVLAKRRDDAPVPRRDAVRLALWRSVRAGAWAPETLAVGEWTACGSLFGVTAGAVVFLFAARGGTVHGGAIMSMRATTTHHRPSSFRVRVARSAVLWAITALVAVVVGALTAGWTDEHRLVAAIAVVAVACAALPLFLLGPEVRAMRRHDARP